MISFCIKFVSGFVKIINWFKIWYGENANAHARTHTHMMLWFNLLKPSGNFTYDRV
jgi:hypothetical protein